ncbi:MAG: class I SAM-dependent DNA methyltransferase [Proteobacteria bacterium]|nr:class I SAM-dependent DNA methyltransferase [Pseudomonadota bacterium]
MPDFAQATTGSTEPRRRGRPPRPAGTVASATGTPRAISAPTANAQAPTPGLIFLKHISNAFEELHSRLSGESPEVAEDRDEYVAERVFFVPEAARWAHLQANARLNTISALVDQAMQAIEDENESLRTVLPKAYNRPALDTTMVGRLIDLVSTIPVGRIGDDGGDVLGRVYEYFLGSFAANEGKRGGEYFTPRSIVRLLVEMLEPYKGSVYDPCCGSGGMFVHSEAFVRAHGGTINDISIYGQESNYTTWRLVRMNLAVRGIDSDIRWNAEGSFLKDELKDERFDVIMANPPFNISDWSGDRLQDDVRWTFGAPSPRNANFAWLQHIHWHLRPTGSAGVVLANGSMSSTQNGEGEIRRKMVEADAVDCIVALPGQLFTSVQIPACLWFLTRAKAGGPGRRDRRGGVLFIDARQVGSMASRTLKVFADDDLGRIASTYHAWKAGEGYEDVPGFCKVATIAEIAGHGHVLTPGRFVGAEDLDEDDEPFEERMARLVATLSGQRAEAARLDAAIAQSLAELGYGG